MKKLLIFLCLCLCAPAWATTTVTGNLKTLGGGSISLGTFVRFYLRGCSGNQPRINGTAIIGPTLGNVFYIDFVPNASGAISGTIYSTTDTVGTGNGDIECGGIRTGLWYGMVVFLNGKSGPETPIPAKNTATIDISSITPLTANPVITSPTGDQTYARLDGGNQPFTALIQAPSGVISGALTTQSENGDLWVGTGAGQYSSMAACYAALTSGHTCHISAGWTETFAANLVLSKNQTGFIAHGLATITMSTFSITQASGVSGTFLKSFCLSSSTSNGPCGLYLKYSGSGFAVDIGDASADVRTLDLEGVFIETTSALAGSLGNTGGLRLRRIQTFYMNNVISNDSGANAATHIGFLFDGTGTFTGNGLLENCSSNGSLESLRLVVGNLVHIKSGNYSTAIASGIGINFLNAEGNIIDSVDIESTATALNFANASSVSNNRVRAFLQNNTTDVVYGAASHDNYVDDVQGAAAIVTDNSAAANNNSVWSNGTWRVDKLGNYRANSFTAVGGSLANPSLGIGTANMGFFAGTGATCWTPAGNFSDVCFLGTPAVSTRSNGTFAWVGSGNPDGTIATGLSSPAAGVVSVDTTAVNNALGTIKPAALLSGGAAAGTAGTGACATITTNVGGSLAGSFKCTGTTGAATVTITPGTTATNGWICSVFDETTRANLLQQTSHTTTTCVLTATSVTQNDVFVFNAIAF